MLKLDFWWWGIVVYMGKKLTTEEFIEKARDVHGDRYDYSLTEYKNKTEKIKIICKEHGTFEQSAYSHIKGFNCKKCSTEVGRLKTVISLEQFISKAKEVHGDLYSYKNSDYINGSTNIEILCGIHGSFLQTPNNHTRGKGCKLCGHYKAKVLRAKTNEDFKEEASKIHNNFYSYDKVNYINWNEDIIITCPTHGDFKQRAGTHLKKSGCTLCVRELDFRKRSHYITLAEKAQIYLVRLSNEEEEFYKIGKTINSTSQRMSGKRMPYEVDIVHEYKDEIVKIYDLEIELHKLYKAYKYIPNIRFKGYTECYTLDLPIQEIINI